MKKLNVRRHGSYTLPLLADSMTPSFRKSPHYESDPSYPFRQHQLTMMRGELNRSKCRVYSDEFLQKEEINVLLCAPFPEKRTEKRMQEAFRMQQMLDNLYVMSDSFFDQDDGTYLYNGGAVSNEPLYKEIIPVN